MMKEKTDKIVTVVNLTKKFGDFVAVNNISFEVDKGEIFGFLGANGAGKTTAMRMLTGLSVPTSGKAVVAGYDVAKYPEKVKFNIGYMSQKFSLYNDLKVFENIRLYAGIYGMAKKKIAEKTEMMLTDLGMYDYRDKLVGDIPLGWKQKLAFSVALVHDPPVVFLDEPTSGVDPITRRQFWELIYKTSRAGTTVFVTTHYLDEAEYCNRVSIMVDGYIKALDTPYNLKKENNVDDMEKVFIKLTREGKSE
ncbi:MAG: ABC transporter ATP-binding protein [Saprospiraceae bacterium]|nr:ABC transporter ATP-binding protein [Saprospiraceae bacterium]